MNEMRDIGLNTFAGVNCEVSAVEEDGSPKLHWVEHRSTA